MEKEKRKLNKLGQWLESDAEPFLESFDNLSEKEYKSVMRAVLK